MSAEDDVRRATVRLSGLTEEAFLGVVEEAFRSIVEGSELTGAPGQPVQTGQLKGSWAVVPEGAMRATIGTNLAYAPPIEDGVGAHGPLTLRSPVGGFHSVALTVGGMDRIVDAVVARTVRGRP